MPAARFFERLDDAPAGGYDAVLLSGVLHHVHPRERPFVLAQATERLAPGGLLAVFEHNPANPLTRRAVATCEFDDDAILLWPFEASGLCKGAGLSGVKTEFIVFFPAALRALRAIEPHLGWLPVGAQYVVTGRR